MGVVSEEFQDDKMVLFLLTKKIDNYGKYHVSNDNYYHFLPKGSNLDYYDGVNYDSEDSPWEK